MQIKIISNSRSWYITISLYAVDLASIDRRDVTSEHETTKRVEKLKKAYVHSDIHREIMHNMEQTEDKTDGTNDGQQKSFCSTILTSLALFSVLLRYSTTVSCYNHFTNT